MNYNLWVLSIYDEYRKEYQKQFPQKKFIDKIKELSMYKMILLIGYISIVIVNTVFCIYELSKNNFEYLFFGLFVDLFIATLTNSQIKVDFQDYKKRLKVFEKILIKENLNDIELLKKFQKDTSGLLNKIINSINEKNINIFSTFLEALGITYIIKILDINFILISVCFIIMGGFILYLMYSIIIEVPNNKYQKKRDMNELIKIYMTYKNYK
ncbi:MAG: hypothetical protein ACI33J_05140 [Clostridium sp.]